MLNISRYNKFYCWRINLNSIMIQRQVTMPFVSVSELPHFESGQNVTMWPKVDYPVVDENAAEMICRLVVL